MSKNPEKDAIRTAATRRRILESGFRVFAERTIDKVTMFDVAAKVNIGIASLYRYYNTKDALVLGISTWVWEKYNQEVEERLLDAGDENMTAAQEFEFFLDSFLDLYRNHRDILRFNQFFNIYVQSEAIKPEHLQPYHEMIHSLEQRFHGTYEKGKIDGTLRTEISEQSMFSCTLHLMLASVTRYAVGLVYEPKEAGDPEADLLLLKKMLLKEYVRQPD